jgi:cleavage and polyadenylation specificity factor subunit 4
VCVCVVSERLIDLCFIGPNCRNKHVRKLVCQNYLTGFCPDGLNCPNGHPKYELPVMYIAQDQDQPSQQQQQQQQSHFNNTQQPDDHHNKPYNRQPQQQQQHFQPQQQHHNQGGQQQQQQGTFRKLEDVTCYKCGQQGHYANKCTQGRKQQQ